MHTDYKSCKTSWSESHVGSDIEAIRVKTFSYILYVTIFFKLYIYTLIRVLDKIMQEFHRS